MKVKCRIYNVTPLEGLKDSLTPLETHFRIIGTDCVYVMEKFQDGWKIVDQEWHDYFGDNPGEERWREMWNYKEEHFTYYGRSERDN